MENVADLANIITAISLIVGLIALFHQVRSTRRQVELQNFTEYTRRYQEIVLNLPQTINSPDFDFLDLSDELRDKSLRFMRAYYDLCSEEHYLNKNGLVDQNVWELWSDGMCAAFKKRAFRDAWDLIQKDSYFSNDFSQYVEVIRRCNIER